RRRRRQEEDLRPALVRQGRRGGDGRPRCRGLPAPQVGRHQAEVADQPRGNGGFFSDLPFPRGWWRPDPGPAITSGTTTGETVHMESHQNLLAGPPPTLLPDQAEAREMLEAGTKAADVAARFPAYSAAWAALADDYFAAGHAVTSYAFA